MKLFGLNIDRLLIQLPVFFLIISIIQVMFVMTQKSPVYQFSPVQLFVVECIFFSAFHVPLTFVLFFTIPEFKLWAKHTKNSGPFSFWINCLIVYILSASILYLGGGLIQDQSYSYLFFIIAYFFRNLMRFYHNIGQATGVSVLINQKYIQENQDYDAKLFERLRKWEGHVSFFLIWFISLFTVYLLILEPGSKKDPIFIGFLILLVPCFAFLFIALSYPKKMRFLKFQFLLRHFFCPLQFFSPIAFGARLANHGMENFFIVNKILNNSKNEHKKLFIQVSSFAVIVWIIWCIPRELGLRKFAIGDIRLFFSLLWAVDLTHFWAERVLYRMRDQYTKKMIGPFLTR